MSRKESDNGARKIALTAILSAFIIIILFLESIVPTGRLGFYALASFILSVIVLENGVRWGWLAYAVTSLTAALIIPEKLNLLPYFVFFGIYTLVKYHIEYLRKKWLEIILKLIAFNLPLWIFWDFVKGFLPDRLTEGLIVIVAGIILQVAFFVYDKIFTLWLNYYFEKIAPKVRKY